MATTDRDPAELIRVFEIEAGLLSALGTALEHQRGAVAAGDSRAFDSWTDGVRGLCDEFRAAESHRMEMLTAWTGTASPKVVDLEMRVATTARPRLETARRRLADAARLTAHELSVNRKVLARAIEFGDGLVRTVLGGFPGGESAGYGQGSAPSALIFDRTA